MKKCSTCKKVISYNYFYKDNSRKDGLQRHCKSCHNTKAKIHKNSEKHKLYKEALYQSEKWKEYQKAYKKSKKYKEYRNNRNKVDTIFNLKNRISWLIRNSFKNKCLTKTSKAVNILGINSYEEFYSHLKDSAIKNYGYYDSATNYHIDHIIPLASAKTEEDVLRLNHYTNLQFLTAKDNILKSDKI